MNNKIGWHFPPTNGGRVDGFNDPGIAHFDGSPLASLARETIQNSLDASLQPGQPVHVSFELIELKPDDIGFSELKEAIERCRQKAKDDDDSSAVLALKRATQILKRKKIPCLCVSDRFTTGLKGKHWPALVKRQGYSYKPEREGAGGSHGIGKYAPFAVSDLRTVFYWTCIQADNTYHEKFQGKSVLMSYDGPDEKERQGTGFYGYKEDCQELTEQIPDVFRHFDLDGQLIQGTCLTIVGFAETIDWRRRIAASVLANFFYAIESRKLSVIVEPELEGSSNLLEINHGTMAEWFDHLEDNKSPENHYGADGSSLQDARTFWQISRREPIAEKQDGDLGHCKLWLSTGDGLPSKVAFVRGTGMLVTTRQKGLIRFGNYRDFAALCVFEDPKGNELLRQMENPAHNMFEPNRLMNKEEQERGRKALDRVTKWVRSEIKKQAGPPEGTGGKILSELAVYLPHYQSEESFDDSGNDVESRINEPGFGNTVKVALRPMRRLRPPRLFGNDGEAEGGYSDDTGNEGGGVLEENTGGDSGGDGGTGDGDGRGGTGSRGGSSAWQGLSVTAVRILPIEGLENSYQLSFLCNTDGFARLTLEEAGDSSVVPRRDIRVIGTDISLDRVPIKQGNRTFIEITADEPIGGRAFRLTAASPAEDSRE